ncbi:MAG: hypothetical protein R3B82_07575 [Sandaracinaceae bacterium]
MGALLVTSHRIAGVKRAPGDVHLTGPYAGRAVPKWNAFAIEHAAVASLKAMVPLLGTEHRVVCRDGTTVVVPRCGAWKNIRAFLSELAEMDPAHRLDVVEPVRDAELLTPAWRTVTRHLDVLLTRGELDPSTADDLRRRILLHRASCVLGTGRTQNGWATALPVPDVAAVLAHLFGPPSAFDPGPPTRLVFPLATPDRTAHLIALNLGGMLSEALLGVGWHAMQSASVDEVHVSITDAPSSATYELTDSHTSPLSRMAPQLVAVIHRVLREREADALVRRATMGWTLPIAELLAVPPEEILERLRTSDPTMDPSRFRTSPDD